jgi:hypothetical protein
MIRFPKGRASERVVSDIVSVSKGIKSVAPIAMGEPLTEAAVIDYMMPPAFPDGGGDFMAQHEAEQQGGSMAPDDSGMLPGTIARGEDLLGAI